MLDARAPIELLRRRWPEGLLALATAAVFAEALLTRAAILARDIGSYVAPMRAWWRARVLEGELPEWLPDLGLGVPFAADPASQSFYPPSVLTLLPLEHGLDLFLVAHLLFAGLGALRLARALGASPTGTLVAGAAFGLGGYMVSMTTSCLYLCSASYTPWIILGALRLRRPGRAPTAVALFGAALSLQLLAGDFQSAMIALALAALLTVAAPRREGESAPTPRVVGRLALLGAAAVALGVLLAAVQLAPSWLLVEESVRRDGVPLEVAQVFSTHPLRLLGLVVPAPWGSPLEGPYYGGGLEVGGKTIPWALSIYSGAAAACLVPLAISGLWKDGRRCLATTLLAAAALLAILALGSHTPLYALAHRCVPLFAMFRYPEKLLAGVSLLVALLCGLGASRVEAPRDGGGRRDLLFGGALPLLLALGALLAWLDAGDVGSAVPGLASDPARRAAALEHLASSGGAAAAVSAAALVALLARRRALLVFCCLIDLGLAAFAVASPANVTEAPVAPPLAERARRGAEALEPMRLYNMRGAFVGDPAAVEPLAHALAEPNRGLVEGVGHLNPYSAAMPNSAETLLLVGARHPARLCAITSATAVLADLPRYRAGPFSEYPPAAGLGPLVLVDLPRRPPRARVLGAARVARSETEAGALLWDPDFPADRVALLIGRAPPGLPLIADDEEPPEPRPCEVTRFEPELVSLRCEAEGTSVVVSAEQFAAGWTVEVDGERRPLLRAQYAMRGVVVGPGRHDLVFRYRTPGLATGLVATAAGLLCLVALGVVGRWRRGEKARAG